VCGSRNGGEVRGVEVLSSMEGRVCFLLLERTDGPPGWAVGEGWGGGVGGGGVGVGGGGGGGGCGNPRQPHRRWTCNQRRRRD